jgi:hypothetical protein
VAADDQIYIWAHWYHTTRINATTTETNAGVDGFTLDTSARHWSTNALVPAQSRTVSTALWTGREILAPGSDIYCGPCSHPAGIRQLGYVLHPNGAPIESLPRGPVDDLRPGYVWTGAALLAFNTGTYTSGGTHTDYPGEAAAWDPTTGAWTSIPNAPLAGEDTVAVWTGSSLIIWGQMFPPKQDDGTGPVHLQTAGLQLGKG